MEIKVGVIGLGYVGLPLALAFAEKYPGTVGFDISQQKIELLKQGIDPTSEGLEAEIATSSLSVTDKAEDLEGCNFFIIGVPTPVDETRRPDLRALKSASEIVGWVLKPGGTVVYESTVYPGVTEDICAPILASTSGLSREQFHLGYSPERINPGDKEHTLKSIVKVVSGESEQILEQVASVYESVIDAGVFRASSIKVAEAAKVIENTQRDLNIALMNELSLIFDRMDISTSDVLEAAGTKWNFLQFKPGLVGGHCIGVDPYYLTTKAEQLGYHPEVILAGRRINDNMGRFVARKAIKMLAATGQAVKGARVGVLGVTFKENVTDLRNSKVPDLIEELRDFGVEVLALDPNADPAEAKRELGIELASWEQLKELDGLVYAVVHQAFAQKDISELGGCIRQGGVLVDVKSVLDRSKLRADIRYWSL